METIDGVVTKLCPARHHTSLTREANSSTASQGYMPCSDDVRPYDIEL